MIKSEDYIEELDENFCDTVELNNVNKIIACEREWYGKDPLEYFISEETYKGYYLILLQRLKNDNLSKIKDFFGVLYILD